MPKVRDADLRPFNESGYEILDEDLLTKGEAVIWSVDPLPPAVGDLYTIESAGAVHELAVAEVTLFKGGWSARCQLFGLLTGS